MANRKPPNPNGLQNPIIFVFNKPKYMQYFLLDCHERIKNFANKSNQKILVMFFLEIMLLNLMISLLTKIVFFFFKLNYRNTWNVPRQVKCHQAECSSRPNAPVGRMVGRPNGRQAECSLGRIIRKRTICSLRIGINS